MFAASQVNKKKVEKIADAYAAYLRGETPVVYPAVEGKDETGGIEQNPSATLTSEEILSVQQRIEERLAKPISEGKISVSVLPRGLVLSLREAAFFDPGQATFRVGSMKLFDEIGEAMRLVSDQPIRLEGHTDNIPIRTEKFPSNWELSAARATEVLRLLAAKFDISPRQLSVTGYGESRPIASNATFEGRAANRRVDIVILSQSAAAMAPRQRTSNLAPVAASLPTTSEKGQAHLPSPPEPLGGPH